MYQLQVRMYHINNEVQAYADLRHEEGRTAHSIAAPTVKFPVGSDHTHLTHDEIVAALHAVCDGIAEELAAPLF